MSRFAADSALLIVCTRWHVDDLLGRYIAKDPTVRRVVFPAIAEEDEKYRKRGEALFPALKPLSFLLERKALMTQASWEAEYQQNPYLVGGGMFPIEKLRIIPTFDRRDIARSCLSVDKAGTEGGTGARTAIVLMHLMKNGMIVIDSVIAGRWEALEREQTILNTAKAVHMVLSSSGVSDLTIAVEQEPGSGGKESAEATARKLMGFNVLLVKPGARQSKILRADPFAAAVQNSNVWLCAGKWVQDYLDECEAFPNGRTLDQVDASAQAFQQLTGGPPYDHTYSGWN
jgi:predicted phage terminase large subunit-like protein